MSSSSNETESNLMKRFKEKLKGALATDSDSDDEENKKKPSSRKKPSHSRESFESDNEEEFQKPQTTSRRKVQSNPIDSDSDDSSISIPKPLSAKRKATVLSESSDGTSSESLAGSDDSGNSGIDEDDESSEAGFIDNEAEEVSETDSLTPDEEGPGDLVSSESDWESDWASDSEQHTERASYSQTNGTATTVSRTYDFSSDSSDGTSEKCPICLLKFSSQEVGTPEACDHSFCADCLEQWSKNMNTCPVDRQEFSLILVRRRVGGKVIRRLTVEKPQVVNEDPDDLTFCEICGDCRREDRMLLCDGCDLGFHIECLDPPLDEIPENDWYCPNCNHASPTSSAEELPLRHTARTRFEIRMITMLRVTRTNIATARRNVALTQPSTSSGLDSSQSNNNSISTRQPKRKSKKKTAVRKKKRKLSRCTAASRFKERARNKKKKGKKARKTNSSGNSRKKKKLTRRKRRKVVATAPRSVKGRLAEQLGVRPPRQPGQSLPDIRTPANVNTIQMDRIRAGIPTLHIFGQRDQLDYFSGSDDEMGASGDVAVRFQSRPVISLEQRMVNRKRLMASLARPSSTRRSVVPIPASSQSVDLVGSILSCQTKMLSKRTQVKINLDGSLDIQLKEPQQSGERASNALDRLREDTIDVNKADPSTAGCVSHAPMYSGGAGARGTGAGGPGRGSQVYRYPRGEGGGGGSHRGGGGDARSPGSFNNSGFRHSFASPDNNRVQYEQFLGNNTGCGRPPSRLRFRLNAPRRPFRRNAMANRGVVPQADEDDDEQAKESSDNASAQRDDEEVDIYSDIEPGSGREGSEDGEREYGALLPPPEPPAMLLNLGDQNSDEEFSDSELVIDDHSKEDKYDPADPCSDSDDEGVALPAPVDIPLPPTDPPERTHTDPPERSPTENESPAGEESESEGSVCNEEIVNGARKDDSEEGTPVKDDTEDAEVQSGEQLPENGVSNNVDSQDDPHVEDSSEDEDDDCPNFSIYSAASMDIARRSREQDDEEEKCIASEIKEAEQALDDSAGNAVSPSEDDLDKKVTEDALLQVDIEKSEQKALEDSAKDSGSEDPGEADKSMSEPRLVEEIFGSDDDSEMPCSSSGAPAPPTIPGLEGLETEVISDCEGAAFGSDTDGFSDDKKRKRRRSRRSSDAQDKSGDPAEFEDGEIVDEAQRLSRKRDKSKKDVHGDENLNISKPKDSADEDRRKKRRKGDSPADRAPLSSSENKSKERDKDRGRDRDKDKDKKKDDEKDKEKSKEDIAWKKPSKSTKDRNYRDGKERDGKDRRDDKREEERENARKDRRKKEKRKDLERYDVRKVLSDKTLSRQNKDAFGRDLDIRRRSHSKSRSRSRSPVRQGRVRSRSRSRSHRRLRSRSRSRSRGRSPIRARGRQRSLSRPGSPNRLRGRRSRSRSRPRSVNRSRSRHRSPKDRYASSKGAKKKARDSSKKDDGPRSRNRSLSRERRRETREVVREEPRAWSRSPSKSWSPSLSGSPQYPASQTGPARSYSRSWSRERDRLDRISTSNMAGSKHKTHKNLTVIVTNNKEERRKRKDQKRRGGNRRGSPAPSKEVFASGDNILVSVNFRSNKSGASTGNAGSSEKSKKRKDDKTTGKRSKKDKNSRTKSDTLGTESSKTGEKRKKAPPEASQKPVAIIDLEQSPYREYTPSPKDLIVLSDSEEDGKQTNSQIEELMHEDTASNPDDDLCTMGPKTPPEPQVKFSISSKTAIRTITNPLMEDDDEPDGEESGTNELAEAELDRINEMMHKGPNTPPESPMGPATPGSSPTSPDAYDPFDPTKSRSASPDEGTGERVAGAEDEPRENGTIAGEEEEARSKVEGTDNKTSPLKSDKDCHSPGTTAPEVDEADKGKQMSPSSSADASSVVSKSVKTVPTSVGSTEVTSTSSTRTALQSQRLLSAVMKGAIVSRPIPKTTTPIKSIPRQNGEPSAQTDVVDMDIDSPYSPASSEGDDLFEPPPVFNSKSMKPSGRPKAAAGAQSKSDKFDSLFGSSPVRTVKYSNTTRGKSSGKNAGRNQAKLNKIVKHQLSKIGKGNSSKLEEEQLKILDEVPSSAVEMQVKDKFLKKLNRQERVVEEVKLALKPHYYKKHINKDDYKEILRRSVPKICHNRSGEINPIKIRTLIEAYVKKIRYLKRKAAGAGTGHSKNKACTTGDAQKNFVSLWK